MRGQAFKVVSDEAVKVGSTRVCLCGGGLVTIFDEVDGELVVPCYTNPLKGGHLVGGDGYGASFADGGFPTETALRHSELARGGVQAMVDVFPLSCARHGDCYCRGVQGASERESDDKQG